MKTIRNSIVVLLVLLVGSVFSQNNTGEIKGKVLELETGEPLPMASVYVKVGERLVGTNTDFDGNFTLKPLRAGTYNLFVSYLGIKKELRGVMVTSDKITYIDDFLFSSTLETVDVVYWKRKLIDKGNPSIEALDLQMIQQTPLSRNPVELLSYSVPGISINSAGETIIRGSRPGSMGYYVDGVKTNSLDGIPGRAIGSLSVYTGGVPAQYGDITSGVIIVETMSYFDLYNASKR